jgi:hypothetical protein
LYSRSVAPIRPSLGRWIIPAAVGDHEHVGDYHAQDDRPDNRNQRLNTILSGYATVEKASLDVPTLKNPQWRVSAPPFICAMLFRCKLIRELLQPSQARPHRLQVPADAQVKTSLII